VIPRTATLAALAVAALVTASANAQVAPVDTTTEIAMRDPAAVQLKHMTALPGIDGDFDFLAVDLKHDRLFVAGEEHHTIEVFKASTGEHVKSVGGVKTPHALAYVAETNELAVADGGDFSTLFLDADDLHQKDRIAMIDGSVTGKTDSPDTGFYDAKRRTFFVGNGGKSAKLPYSEITAIDVDTHKVTGRIRVEGDNLEAIAIDEAHDRLFVDVRDKKQVAVIDLKQNKVVQTWNVGLNRNTALGFDPANDLVFVGSRAPGLLTVLDGRTGTVVAQVPCADMTDSLSWDAASKRIYIAGSQGLSVFHQDSRDRYTELLRVPTNGGKTALNVPQLKQFYVIHPKTVLDGAALLTYSTAQ
jgi:DNA-binding beta-propeller fold protein YncE